MLGPGGRVVGLEFDEESVYELFKNHHKWVDKQGYDNVIFYHNSGKELRSDLYRQSSLMKRHKLDSVSGLQEFIDRSDQYFDANPVIEDQAVDTLLVTLYLPDYDQANLNGIAHEINRVVCSDGAVLILLPAGKTILSQSKIQQFIDNMQLLSWKLEGIKDHWVTSDCCSEKHYAMLTFLKGEGNSSQSSQESMASLTDVFNEKHQSETCNSPKLLLGGFLNGITRYFDV